MPLNDVPLPTAVAGYASARAQGLTPQVSGRPPAVLPGLSARGRLVLLLAVLGTEVVGVAISTALARSGTASPLAVLAAGGALLVTMLGGVPLVGARHLVELQAGYATLRLLTGLPSFAGLVRPLRGGRLSWDYSGTWVLRPSGGVVSTPAWDAIAPGFYPSPRTPGRFELWTGAEWSRQLRRAP